MAPSPSSSPPTLGEIALTLSFPWQFMAISLSYLPSTLLSCLRALDIRTLLSWPRLRAAWFGRFWAWAGPNVRSGAEVTVVPLLEGRVSRGSIIKSMMMTGGLAGAGAGHPGIGGTVLEIGPGSGMWVSIFSDRYRSSESQSQSVAGGGGDLPAPGTRGRVTRVYGIEPNPSVQPLLREQIAAAGLGDVYEVVPVGIEDLASSGRVAPESVDCIVSVLCLCSIPDPRHNIGELYKYLKPGGRWYVYEHVKRERTGTIKSWGMWAYQAFVNLVWPHMIGGCELRRETEKWLREAGSWSEVDLAHPEGEPWFSTLPHIVGVLTK